MRNLTKTLMCYNPITLKHQGFTLLEVMVALLIFSVGLLGLAGLQMSGIQNTQYSMVRSIAVQQAYDMAERLRANRAGVAAGSYDNLKTSTVSCVGSPDVNNPCSSIPDGDFKAWDTSNQSMLPTGQGVVSGIDGVITVTVCWKEDRSSNISSSTCPPASDELAYYQLTVIP